MHNIRYCLFVQTIFSVKLINTSACLSSLLLSCVERMAFGTDFYVDILLCGSCYKCVSAVAGYSCLIVIRMDSFSHDFHLSVSHSIFYSHEFDEFSIKQLIDYIMSYL